MFSLYIINYTYFNVINKTGYHRRNVHVAIPARLQDLDRFSMNSSVVDPHLHACLEVCFHTWK